ncbi:MAG: hypothetical protein AAF208_06240 [Cyanobacteria bacterium P01_A01_bin.45]
MNLKKSTVIVGIMGLLLGCNGGESPQNTGSKNTLSNSGFEKQVTVPIPNETASVSEVRKDIQTEDTQKSNRRQETQKISSNSIQKDNLIVPGERVGVVTKKTTRADLVREFGGSNLKDDTAFKAEGTVKVPVTKVNEGKKDYFIVEWKDETRKQLTNIVVLGSEWKTPEGISVGTSIKKLENVLGEFKFSGLAWDFAGIVQIQDTKLSKYQNKILLRLGMKDSKESQQLINKYSDEYGKIVGDTIVSSNDLNVRPFNIEVDQIQVFLGDI